MNHRISPTLPLPPPQVSVQQLQQLEQDTVGKLLALPLDKRLQRLWEEHQQLGPYVGVSGQLPLSRSERRLLLHLLSRRTQRSQRDQLSGLLREEFHNLEERPLMLSLSDGIRLHEAIAASESDESAQRDALLGRTLQTILRCICAGRLFRRLDRADGIELA